nr:hypothetical protein TorRG33x02_152150 [Ipomoea batatas]
MVAGILLQIRVFHHDPRHKQESQATWSHVVKREEANGDNRFEVNRPGHGDRVDEFKDADEEVGEGGAEGHVDHGEGDGVRPVVHLAVEDVLVVDDDSEGEEDPDGDVGVGEDDLLQYTVAQISSAAHGGVLSLAGTTKQHRNLSWKSDSGLVSNVGNRKCGSENKMEMKRESIRVECMG